MHADVETKVAGALRQLTQTAGEASRQRLALAQSVVDQLHWDIIRGCSAAPRQS